MAYAASLCAQPKIALKATTNLWMEENRILRFGMVLTNSGNKTFLFGDKLREPHKFVDWPPNVAIVDLYEAALHDQPGNVVKYSLNAGVFAFKSKDRPQLEGKRGVYSLEAGALNLQGLSNGLYYLVLRANPVGQIWPRTFFEEAGSVIVFSLYEDRVLAHRPPRPILNKPLPSPAIIARYKAMMTSGPVPPTPSPLPRKATNFPLPGRWLR